MKCDRCKWSYPDEMLNPMFANGGYTKPVCGLCALEIGNEISGVKRLSFQGEMAENYRLRAIKYRSEHPDKAPNGLQ